MFLGTLFGSTSPVTTYSPLLGAELTLAAGTTVRVPVDPSYELGVLVDTGAVTVDGKPLAATSWASSSPGRRGRADGDEEARLLVLGGPPFGEKIVMWWNFIGREHDEVADYRAQWEALVAERRRRPLRAPARRPARGPARPPPAPRADGQRGP